MTDNKGLDFLGKTIDALITTAITFAIVGAIAFGGLFVIYCLRWWSLVLAGGLFALALWRKLRNQSAREEDEKQ